TNYGESTQAFVVVQRAEVDDLAAVERQASGCSAGGEKQLGITVDRALVVCDALVLRVQVPGGPAEVKRYILLFAMAPDALQRFTFPELLRERRTVVRRVRLGAQYSDGAARIDLADALDCSVGSHSATDDQVRVVRHGSLLFQRVFSDGASRHAVHLLSK